MLQWIYAFFLFSKGLCGVNSPIPAISCNVLRLLVQWHLIFFWAFFTPDIFHLSKQKEAQVEFITLMAAFNLGELLPGFWCCACSLIDVASYLETLNGMEPSLTLLDCAFTALTSQNVCRWSIVGQWIQLNTWGKHLFLLLLFILSQKNATSKISQKQLIEGRSCLV